MVLFEIVLPTYNRANAISAYIERLCNESCLNNDVLLSIYDSSENDDTEKIVRSKDCSFIRYKKLAPDTDVDIKTIFALKESIGKYVYLCGDGYYPNLINIISLINKLKNQFDILCFYPKDYCFDKSVYFDKSEFLKRHFAQLILYGGSVCLGDIVRGIDIEKTNKLFGFSNFSYPSLLSIYSNGPYYVFCGDYFEPLEMNRKSGWIKHKLAIKIWAKNFYLTINKLAPYIGQEVVDEININSHSVTKFLTIKGLINLRSLDNYDYKIYKEYKEYLIKRKGCNIIIALLISIFPKTILRIILKIRRKLRKVN